jgi:hypothetical protein
MRCARGCWPFQVAAIEFGVTDPHRATYIDLFQKQSAALKAVGAHFFFLSAFSHHVFFLSAFFTPCFFLVSFFHTMFFICRVCRIFPHVGNLSPHLTTPRRAHLHGPKWLTVMQACNPSFPPSVVHS